MPVASAPAVKLSPRQRRVLEQVARAASTPQVIATRARIVLAAADGASNRGLAQELHLARNTAQVWRDRWVAATEALAAAALEGGDGDDRAVRAVVLGVLADAPPFRRPAPVHARATVPAHGGGRCAPGRLGAAHQPVDAPRTGRRGGQTQ